MLGITETWLHGNVRHDSRGGGVGLMFKKSQNVKFPVAESYNSFEMVNAEIKLGGQSINLYVIYRPPPSSENRLSGECFLDEFGTLFGKFCDRSSSPSHYR